MPALWWFSCTVDVTGLRAFNECRSLSLCLQARARPDKIDTAGSASGRAAANVADNKSNNTEALYIIDASI